jgi:cob(I)alamin adenosyltransferase
MVNLTRIYTKTGDTGTTALGDFSRTRKTDPRLAAYADANEANAALGVAIAAGGLREDVKATLLRIQNELFDVGADLCLPLAESYAYAPLRVDEAWITDLEQDCDRYLAELEPLRSFILPGGSAGAGIPARRHDHRAASRAVNVGGHRGLWRRAGRWQG